MMEQQVSANREHLEELLRQRKRLEEMKLQMQEEKDVRLRPCLLC